MQRRRQQARDSNAPPKPGNWVEKCLSALKSGRRTPPNNENRRGDPLQTNAAAIQAHPPSRQVRRKRPRAADYVALAAFAFAVVFHSPARATADDAAQLFRTGRAAFERQDYAAALQAFEAAARAGLSGPAVNFNIGVAAFRLGHYQRAEAAFIETARTPAMTALAHYNLGLTLLRSGDLRAAARWFERAEQEAGEERLRSLASAQLASLPPPADRTWVGYASLAAGYDDNVALVSDSSVIGVSGIDDSFAAGQFALSVPLTQSWRLDAGVVLLDYQTLDRFDQFDVQGGALYRLLTGPWTTDLGLQLAYSTLDGEGFENKRILALQTSRQLSGDWQFRARYRFNDIDGMNEFTAVGGRRHQAGVRLGWIRGPWNLGVAYELDVGNYDDEALSARRHQLAVDVEHELNEFWTLAVGAALRHSRYDVAENGEEDRTEFALAVTRVLSTRWRLVLQYAYADNDADLAGYNYDRNRISAMLAALL